MIQLNILGAVARDVPVPARYNGERSSLSPGRTLISFPVRLCGGLLRRVWWRYFVHDITMVTLFLAIGSIAMLGGTIFGLWQWEQNSALGRDTPPGTLVLALLPVVMGFQLLLQALLLDITSQPDEPLSNLMAPEGWSS